MLVNGVKVTRASTALTWRASIRFMSLSKLTKAKKNRSLVARGGQSFELAAERGSRTRVDGEHAFAVGHLATGQPQRAVGIAPEIGPGPIVLVGKQKGLCCRRGQWGRRGAEHGG